MSNLQVIFDYWWLLFLIIPALMLATIPYFRLSKKYRRTRNRVTSMVLFICVMLLSITVLSGLVFAYEKPNIDNEMFILVDMSYSNRSTQEKKNSFVERILQKEEATFKIGVITFAREPYLASPLSRNMESVLAGYKNAPRPSYLIDEDEDISKIETIDDTATNIAAAFEFARVRFTNKKTAKVVLITDGIETDGMADAAIMSLISDGIRVDTVFVNNIYDTEVQITGIETPDYNFYVDTPIRIGVRIQSNYSVSNVASLTMFDNGIESVKKEFNIVDGENIVFIDYAFSDPGPHQIYVVLEEPTKDIMHQNNCYYAYLFISSNDRILIIDRKNESAELFMRLNDERFSKLDQIDIANISKNNTLSFLAEYDQIILMNIANSDLPDGFDAHLYAYVNELGGGLLTVGGSDPQFPVGHEEVVPHAYDKEDMNPGGKPSIYQSLLPVICEGYTPPLALMLVIDRSGSMAFTNRQGDPTMDVAKLAAKEAIGVLSHRDYVGLVSFSSNATTDCELVPFPQKSKVENAIDRMIPVGGTIYGPAMARALIAMNAVNKVENKHIVFITDGEPEDKADDDNGYNRQIDLIKEAGIIMSFVTILSDGYGNTTIGETIAKRSGGKALVCNDVSALGDLLKEFLKSDEIVQYNPENFKPTIQDHGGAVIGVVEEQIPMLGGFYGARARSETTGTRVHLVGPFGVPIYAQWNVGTNGGKVGSFMSDLNGNWSSMFLNDPTGQMIIDNIIRALLPSESVFVRDIVPELHRDNYNLQIRVNTGVAQGEKVTVIITDITEGRDSAYKVQLPTDTSSGFPKCVFTFPQEGVYEITIEKKNAAGIDVVPPYTTHTVFSYSDEYIAFTPVEQLQEFLVGLAARSGGSSMSIAVENADKVYEDIPKTYDDKFDPRITFIIIVIVLFLLDMAVKKFKFKWPWEIVQNIKIKNELKKTNG